MGTVNKLADKIRYGLFLEWLSDRLKALGFELLPFYLVVERTEWAEQLSGNADDLEGSTRFLTREDMTKLDHVDGRAESAEELARRIDAGGLCYAFENDDGTIAAFTWADLIKSN